MRITILIGALSLVGCVAKGPALHPDAVSKADIQTLITIQNKIHQQQAKDLEILTNRVNNLDDATKKIWEIYPMK